MTQDPVGTTGPNLSDGAAADRRREQQRLADACETEARTHHALRCASDRQRAEDEVLARLDETWLGADLKGVLRISFARRHAANGFNTPYADCVRTRQLFVQELNSSMLQAAALGKTALPPMRNALAAEPSHMMPFRLPYPLPPYILILHTPEMRQKDRQFGVGWSSSSCIIEKLCVAVAPACAARADQIRANLRDFDRHLQTRPHASALFLFSMHPLRGIETVHWQMHSLECDQEAFGQKVAAAEEKHEADAGAAAAQSASGKKNAAGKRRQQDKARPALAAATNHRLIRDGDLSLSVDDNVVVTGVHTLTTSGKPRVDVSAVGKDDGCRAFPQPSEKEFAIFRNATSAVCLDPGPVAPVDPTATAAAKTGDGSGDTRLRRLADTLLKQKAECERQLEEAKAAAVRERHRLVEGHIEELNQREQALKDERSTHLQSVQAATAVATNAKQLEFKATQRAEEAEREVAQTREMLAASEAALQTERRQLKDARKERDQFKQQCEKLQRNQSRSAATYNTSVSTLSERIAGLEAQLTLAKDGRQADAAEHAKTVKQLTFDAQEAAEWRRMSDERSVLAAAALSQRAEEAEGLLAEALAEAAKRPESATAETQTPEPPPAPPPFSLEKVALETKYAQLYTQYERDVGKKPPELPAMPTPAPAAAAAASTEGAPRATAEGEAAAAAAADRTGDEDVLAEASADSPEDGTTTTTGVSAGDGELAPAAPVSQMLPQAMHPAQVPSPHVLQPHAAPYTPHNAPYSAPHAQAGPFPVYSQPPGMTSGLPPPHTSIFDVVCAAQTAQQTLVNVVYRLAADRPDYGATAVSSAQGMSAAAPRPQFSVPMPMRRSPPMVSPNGHHGNGNGAQGNGRVQSHAPHKKVHWHAQHQ